MAKTRLTKNELKKQKDNLKRFTRYLPTLELKKKQLLLEIRNIQRTMDKLQSDIDTLDTQVYEWVDLFAEDVHLDELIKIQEIKTEQGNIAGIDIPILRETVFDDIDYDYFTTPLWIDRGIAVCKERMDLSVKLRIAEQGEAILREELRVTIQRIKLFEEVKIPEARENIRVIQIFLGDQMTAEVVRGKIAKAKIEKKRHEAVRA